MRHYCPNTGVRRRSTGPSGCGVDLNGKDVRLEVEGFLARAFQHEMDHLEGKLFWDMLGKVKRDMLKRKFKKILKEMQE